MSELWRKVCGDTVSETGLVVRSAWIEDVDEVRDRLCRFGGEGWVCELEEVHAFDDGWKPGPGLVLSAEAWHQGRGVSLSVRHRPGGWRLVEFEEVEQPGEREPGDIPTRSGAARRVLAVEQTYVSSRQGRPARMAYRVYWCLQPDVAQEEGATGNTVKVWRPWVAAFRGWRFAQRGIEEE